MVERNEPKNKAAIRAAAMNAILTPIGGEINLVRGRRPSESLTTLKILVILERFARTPPEVCVYQGRREISSRVLRAGWFPGQAKLAGQTGFRNRSFLAEGRKQSHRRPRVPHLGGLCGPEAAKRCWLFPDNSGKTTDHRPVSRLRLERRQTRSSNHGASVCLHG
jgi:hypothetical protein